MDVLLNRRRGVLRDLGFMGWNNTFAMVMMLREENYMHVLQRIHLS
jgi:hypothetical protein